MRRAAALIFLSGLVAFAGLVAAQTNAGKTLDIYYIDTEGGQSTLFVSPTGESLLVDTGNAGGRDLERIVAAISTAGVKQIDHMWTTHYHDDHVGAMEELAKRVPITHFYDHGPLATSATASTPKAARRTGRSCRSSSSILSRSAPSGNSQELLCTPVLSASGRGPPIPGVGTRLRDGVQRLAEHADEHRDLVLGDHERR